MRYQHARSGRAASLLLLAMLLYIGSVALDPVVHALDDAPVAAAAGDAVSGSSPAGEPTRAALDHECELCKLARTATAPSAALMPAVAPTEPVLLIGAASDGIRGPPVTSSVRSRAPPSA